MSVLVIISCVHLFHSHYQSVISNYWNKKYVSLFKIEELLFTEREILCSDQVFEHNFYACHPSLIVPVVYVTRYYVRYLELKRGSMLVWICYNHYDVFFSFFSKSEDTINSMPE